MELAPAADDLHPQHRGGRRKAAAAGRAWLVVSTAGQAGLEEAGKHGIMARTGLPARDLRVLDPLRSCPSTILGRGRAIVVNLEHVKAIITAAEVLIANPKDAGVPPFVRELQSRLSASRGGPSPAAESPDVDGTAILDTSSSTHSFHEHEASRNEAEISKKNNNLTNGLCNKSGIIKTDAHKDVGTKILPFEFLALEVCLESACRRLEAETLTLEQEAYPALDELTLKISTLNLERVRQIKSRLVAISGRVQKVRDELEQLLDDEVDMNDMYLSDKLAQQQACESSPRVEVENDTFELEEDRIDDRESERDGSNGSVPGFKPNVQELEMLLEAYFIQIDGTLNKLSHLREYVDDTEDYINIMLDDKQNQLLQMEVLLITATLVITAGVAVVGMLGMNIGIGLYNQSDDADEQKASNLKFWETALGTVVGCVILYISAVFWGKKSGLLQ